MKKLLPLFCIVLGLLSVGCGNRDSRNKQRGTYPPPDESAPSSIPAMDDDEEEETFPAFQKMEAPEESWIQRKIQHEELIRSLREQAARADPDDPFALTEEEIDELSKLDGLEIQ